ncbi:MAG: phosphatidate cytidylyltransferase [Opitutales bacterium]|nr:phosphatidate cytidylyltransferase [Opitutales bacterium]
MMIQTRIKSSIVIWGTLLALILAFKSFGLLLATLLIAFCAITEYNQITQVNPLTGRVTTILSLVFLLIYYTCAHCPSTSIDWLYLGVIGLLCHWHLFVEPSARTFFLSLFQFLYIPFNLHFFIKIIEHYQWSSQGIWVIGWLVCITKITDVGGYFIGTHFGKTPLAPSVSPHKTVEGIYGGFIFAIITSWLYRAFFGAHLPAMHWITSLGFTLILSWISILSDLIESLIKRYFSVKDSSQLLPGIGGILDLVDSLLLSIPLAYFLIKHFF